MRSVDVIDTEIIIEELSMWEKASVSLQDKYGEKVHCDTILGGLPDQIHVHKWPTLGPDQLHIQVTDTLSWAKKSMHGRKRTECRKSLSKLSARMEDSRKTGKLSGVIKALTNKSKAQVDLTYLKRADGSITTSPSVVDHEVCTFFADWHKFEEKSAPPFTQRESNWEEMFHSRESFIESHLHMNIPVEVLNDLYEGISYPLHHNREGERVLTEESIFTGMKKEFEKVLDVDAPPSLDTFIREIRSKGTTSAGPTGLSHAQLKAWPLRAIELMHQCLVVFWKDLSYPEWWDYRWLVPLSKVPVDPGLTDLRPIMLIEVIRKLWFGIIIKRIQTVWDSWGAGSEQQQGVRKGCSTASASVLVMNSLEQAEESACSVFLANWDQSKAFDRVAFELRKLVYYRMGIPRVWSEYLAYTDMTNKTMVRTPLSTHNWKERHRKGLPLDLDSSTGPQPGISWFFRCGMGVGQGDTPSPFCWLGFSDICQRADEFSSLRLVRLYIESRSSTLHPSKDPTYVDDKISLTVAIASIRSKAELLSGFSLVFHQLINIKKLLMALACHGSEDIVELPDDLRIAVYSTGWTPTLVPVQRHGSVKFVGIHQRIFTSATESVDEAQAIVRDTLLIMKRKWAHANTKIAVAFLSTYNRAKYKLVLSQLTTERLEEFDTMFAQFVKHVGRMSQSIAHDLFYLSPDQCGLGLSKLSDAVNMEKLAVVTRCIYGDLAPSQSASALVERCLRQTGVYRPEASVVFPPPFAVTKAESVYWAYSSLQFLQKYNLQLIRGGTDYMRTEIGYNDHITTRYPSSERVTVQLHELGIHFLNDLIDTTSSGRRYWISMADVVDRHMITDTFSRPEPRLDTSDTKELLGLFRRISSEIIPEGNLWISRNHLWVLPHDPYRMYEILGWTHDADPFCRVRRWISESNRCMIGNVYKLEDQSVGAGTDQARLLSWMFFESGIKVLATGDLTHKAVASLPTKGVYRIITYTSRGIQTPSVPLSQPTWIENFYHQIAHLLPDGPLAIYTDGAFKSLRSAGSIIFDSSSGCTSGAGIVIMSDSEDWRQRQKVMIPVSGLAELLPSSVQPAEAYAILGGTIIGRLHNKGFRVFSDSDNCRRRLAFPGQAQKSYRTAIAFVIQAILEIHPLTPETLIHVSGHPERVQKDKALWTRDQLGNHLADRAATLEDTEMIEAQYLVSHMTVLPVVSAVHFEEYGLRLVPYTILHNGRPLARKLKELVQSSLYKRYSAHREEGRAPDQQTWGLASVQMASLGALQRGCPFKTRVQNMRIVFNNYMTEYNTVRHGMSTMSNQFPIVCIICQSDPSEGHLVCSCTGAAVSDERQQALAKCDLILADYYEVPAVWKVLASVIGKARTATGYNCWIGRFTWAEQCIITELVANEGLSMWYLVKKGMIRVCRALWAAVKKINFIRIGALVEYYRSKGIYLNLRQRQVDRPGVQAAGVDVVMPMMKPMSTPRGKQSVTLERWLNSQSPLVETTKLPTPVHAGISSQALCPLSPDGQRLDTSELFTGLHYEANLSVERSNSAESVLPSRTPERMPEAYGYRSGKDERTPLQVWCSPLTPTSNVSRIRPRPAEATTNVVKRARSLHANTAENNIRQRKRRSIELYADVNYLEGYDVVESPQIRQANKSGDAVVGSSVKRARLVTRDAGKIEPQRVKRKFGTFSQEEIRLVESTCTESTAQTPSTRSKSAMSLSSWLTSPRQPDEHTTTTSEVGSSAMSIGSVEIIARVKRVYVQQTLPVLSVVAEVAPAYVALPTVGSVFPHSILQINVNSGRRTQSLHPHLVETLLRADAAMSLRMCLIPFTATTLLQSAPTLESVFALHNMVRDEHFPFEPGGFCLPYVHECRYSLLVYKDGQVYSYSDDANHIVHIVSCFGVLCKTLLNLWVQIPSRRKELLLHGPRGRLSNLSLGPGISVPILPIGTAPITLGLGHRIHPLDSSIAVVLIARRFLQSGVCVGDELSSVQIRGFRINTKRMLEAAQTVSLEECRSRRLVPMFITIGPPSKVTQLIINTLCRPGPSREDPEDPT